MDGNSPRSLLESCGSTGSRPWSLDTLLFALQLVASWEREAGWATPSAWVLVWALIWVQAGLGLLDWPWAAPSSSISRALYFPHLYTYHPALARLSPWLDRQLIFLFP